VHKGFDVLDTVPHVLTSLEITEPSGIKVVMPADVPNPAWLPNGIASTGQQAWGAPLLAATAFVVFPSVVSKCSWNIVFRPDFAAGKYALRHQDRLVLDTRLNPPRP